MQKVILTLLLIAVLTICGCSSNNNPAGQKLGSGKIDIPTYTIESPASGTILGLISEQGERISKGQPLFAINDEVTDKQEEAVTTKLAKAKADLKSMEEPAAAGTSPGDLSTAQVNYEAARQKADKMNKLLAQGAIPRRQAQAAQAELAAAQAALQSASQHNILLRPSSPEAITSQKQLVAQLQSEQKALREKQLQNEAASPCTGIITEKLAENNSNAQAGQKILSITATDTCTITLNVDTALAAKLQPQQPVTIHVNDYSSFPGYIQSVDKTTVTIFSEAKPEDLPAGSNAEVLLQQ